MTTSTAGVSVIVASARPADVVEPCVVALLTTLDRLCEPCELVLVRDTARHPIPDRWVQGPVRILWTGRTRGSAYARRLGVDAAAFDILLFTDDDTLVPDDWSARMADGVRNHGVVTGGLCSRTTGFWEQCDEAIDAYRVSARTGDGTLKFLSFPNLGTSRTAFTTAALDLSVGNRVDDIELACRLRLAGVRPHLADTVVAVLYPSSYRTFLARKIRHGIGMGRLRKQFGGTVWQRLELGQARHLLRRWIALSLHIAADAGPVRRVQLTAANLAYCFAYLAAAAAHRAGERPEDAASPTKDYQ